MKVTEQIDSLEIMGVNSASYLILPKIIAVVLMFPLLYILSVFFGIIGGLIVGPAVGGGNYYRLLINGIQSSFNPYYVTFSLMKCLVFGFLISSISAFFGYTVEGGAFDVGTASTRGSGKHKHPDSGLGFDFNSIAACKMIEIKNIYKSFENKDVLKNISKVFNQGETNLIIGRSGSGKTVLLKSIVGLHEIDKGQILYDNRDFTSMGQKLRKKLRQEMGMVFQGGALFRLP